MTALARPHPDQVRAAAHFLGVGPDHCAITGTADWPSQGEPE
ncbi:hypothetical protein [Parasphingorhabdus sp.]